MLTAAAKRARSHHLAVSSRVFSRPQLAAAGIDRDYIAAQVTAARWQKAGLAIVLHNTGLSAAERRRVALVNCGPRAVLTSFTAAEIWGLTGWERPEVHVLAPAGTRNPRFRGLVLHRRGDWTTAKTDKPRRLHRLAPALVIAASSFATARPAIGLFAAAVQQRLASTKDLTQALDDAPRSRHRAALLLALCDIGQGAQALSEIDFGHICKTYGLPKPSRQAVRYEPGGRRRYLDAEWRLPDGRVVAVEVDGALHLSARRWYADQLRQNDIVLGGTLVLRYPSAIVRNEPQLVAAQLRRALGP
jgi:hypothetical protein